MAFDTAGQGERATETPSPYWIKVKNPRYSQAKGRGELFENQLHV
jgi:hypothetical protein